jgi:DNA polymerase-3 subunit delta
MSELQALAFFSARRVIVLQQADKLVKAETEQLEKYFENPNRSICFILAASAINHATNFFKKAEKAGIVLDIAEEKPWEKERSMQEWIAQKVAKEGKRVDPSVCLALVKQLGTDTATLHQELEKLICYIGDRQAITPQDLHAVCISVNSENAWQLGEAIFRRDGAAALRITKALLDEGTVFLALLRQIRNQFQTECQVCSILSNGGTPQDVSAQFAFMRGTILDRHIQQAQAYGMTRLKKGLLAIDDTEVMAKNSGSDPKWLAERLIIKLATI